MNQYQQMLYVFIYTILFSQNNPLKKNRSIQFIFIHTKEEDPYSVPIDWQPPLPVFEKTSDENNCPCPDEYCKVNETVLRHEHILQ